MMMVMPRISSTCLLRATQSGSECWPWVRARACRPGWRWRCRSANRAAAASAPPLTCAAARAGAPTQPGGRNRSFALLPKPPLTASQVARLETGDAVRAAVEHFWHRQPAGGNLAYWRRRLAQG